MRLFPLVFLFLAMLSLPAQAEIGFDRQRNALVLSGTIGSLDHCAAAEELVHHPHITSVIINSPGGDAWAGVQLARLFGHADLTAIVPPNARALSAAGIAALGAPRLIRIGSLGLHAPYPSAPEAPLAAVLTDQTRDGMQAVLEDAGLPSGHIRDALATPPHRMLMLASASLGARPHRIESDHGQILRLHSACTALIDLHGRHARRPT